MNDMPTPPEPDAAEDAEDRQESASTGLELAAEAPQAEGQDVEALRRERDQLREQLLRRRAEFENFRRRTDRERQSWAVDAQAELLTELIPTLDHLAQALRAEGTNDSLREGVALIHRDLLATLSRLGLEAHEPTGRRFDPSREHALSRETATNVEVDTVSETYRPGFVYKDRLLRPALVRVAVPEGGDTSSSASSASESAPEEVD